MATGASNWSFPDKMAQYASPSERELRLAVSPIRPDVDQRSASSSLVTSAQPPPLVENLPVSSFCARGRSPLRSTRQLVSNRKPRLGAHRSASHYVGAVIMSSSPADPTRSESKPATTALSLSMSFARKASAPTATICACSLAEGKRWAAPASHLNRSSNEPVLTPHDHEAAAPQVAQVRLEIPTAAVDGRRARANQVVEGISSEGLANCRTAFSKLRRPFPAPSREFL